MAARIRMGISKYTALVIACQEDIQFSAGGPVGGKYVGWITLGLEDRYRPLLNSAPIYDSSEEAIAAMKRLAEELKERVLKDDLDGEL